MQMYETETCDERSEKQTEYSAFRLGRHIEWIIIMVVLVKYVFYTLYSK